MSRGLSNTTHGKLVKTRIRTCPRAKTKSAQSHTLRTPYKNRSEHSVCAHQSTTGPSSLSSRSHAPIDYDGLQDTRVFRVAELVSGVSAYCFWLPLHPYRQAHANSSMANLQIRQHQGGRRPQVRPRLHLRSVGQWEEADALYATGATGIRTRRVRCTQEGRN